MDLDVAYVNTRMRSVKNKLFDKSDYDTALNTKDMQDFCLFLEQKGYKMNLEGSKGYSREAVRRRLGELLIAELDSIRQRSPKSLKEVFDALRERYEAEDIKAVISLKASGFTGDILKELPYPPKDAKFIAKLIESDMDGIIKILDKKRFKMDESYRTFRDKGYVQPMLVAIERKPLIALGKSVENQGEMARSLVGDEMDMLNFLNAMRVKGYGSSSGMSLLPSYRVDTSIMSGDKAFERFMNIVMNKQSFKKFLDKKPAEAEIEMKKYLLGRYRKAITSDPTETGPVLGYLMAKEQEVNNLVTICNLLQKMKKEEIMELLY